MPGCCREAQLDAKELIEGILNPILARLGVGWTLAVVAALVLAWVLYSHFTESDLVKAYRNALEEKEKEVQRVAAENREWRRYFFKLNGISEADLVQIEDAPEDSGGES